MAKSAKWPGCTFDDVIDATLFLIDAEKDLPTLLKVMGELWGAPPYPTLTALGVTWLSGFRFEIKVVAKLPNGSDKISDRTSL